MIDSEAADGVRTITLDRPEAHNALTREGLAALEETVADADEPVLRLRGRGDSFCAGADLEAVDALDAGSAVDFAALGQDVARALATHDGATVATVDGATRGGGLDLALACDVCVCTPASSFAASGVSIGLLGAWGGTVRLPAAVGPSAAADLALTGRVVDADEARRMGLVSRVTDDPGTVADEIASNDPMAVRTIVKRLRDGDAVAARERAEREAFAALVRRRNS